MYVKYYDKYNNPSKTEGKETKSLLTKTYK